MTFAPEGVTLSPPAATLTTQAIAPDRVGLAGELIQRANTITATAAWSADPVSATAAWEADPINATAAWSVPQIDTTVAWEADQVAATAAWIANQIISDIHTE